MTSSRIPFIVFLLCSVYACSAQKRIKKSNNDIVTVGFYNVENLFDTIDSKNTIDEAFLPSSNKEWTSLRYQDKLYALAKVISQIGENNSTPDILGLAEIENKQVLVDLVNTDLLKKANYKIVHYESPDRRGIDVALLYKPSVFTLKSSKSFSLTNPKDTAWRTRDLLLATGKLDGEDIHLAVAHWPSRRGGEEKTSELRINAAKLARSVFDSLIKVNPAVKFLIMGDFNDDPSNSSLRKHLKTVGTPSEMSPFTLFNPMDSLHKPGIGTLEWRGHWNLFDQIIISPSLALGKAGLIYQKAGIFDMPYLRVQTGKYKGNPYRTYAGPKYLGGYSDHLPVYLILEKQ